VEISNGLSVPLSWNSWSRTSRYICERASPLTKHSAFWALLFSEQIALNVYFINKLNISHFLPKLISLSSSVLSFCLDSQATGYTWAGRPVAHTDTKIRRCLKGWQLRPPGRYLWEAPPLQGLQRQPEGHGQFSPLWAVPGQKGRNGRI
jgi:hypothetical protein